LRQFKSNLANARSSPTDAASVEKALAAQGFALQASGTARVEDLERVSVEGPVQPRQQDGNYLVTVGNLTRDTVFSDVIVVLIRSGSPDPETIAAPNVGPGQGVDFTLGTCSALQAYIVGVTVGGGELQQIIPPEGVMTPQLASQVNPDDPGPCVDIWPIVDGS
jgi:hypothetical protein